MGTHVYSKLKLPRLGPVLLGTIARDLGWNIRVYVEDIGRIDYEDALTADLVGISTITSTANRAYAMAEAIREYGVPVVMGGPHVTFLADEALQHCDYVVRGEGEEALPLLMQAIREKSDLSQIPNLSYRDENGEIRNNPQTSTINDLDSLPYPDFNLIVGWKKTKSFHSAPIYPVLTSRGCPYGCKFCSVIGMFGRKMRFRSVENVIGEIEQNCDSKSHIFFYDDNFTANKKRAKQLLREGLLDQNRCAKWSTQVRIDAAEDDELMDLMKRTNCSIVYIGFESVNPAALLEMEKKQQVDEMIAGIKKFKQFNIQIHGMFVLGFDSDDKATTRETIRFAKDSGILSAQFLILTPLPGTPLYDQLAQENRIAIRDWSHYDAHHVVHKPKNMSTFDLQFAQIKGHAMFYSRRRTLSKLLKGYVADSAIYLYARHANAQYKRANRIYLKALRLTRRARDFTINFDFEFDLSEIKRQVRRAAGALSLAR